MTNKDTNPLRERIEKTLNKISGYNYNEYGEEIYSYISGENEATDNLLSLMEEVSQDRAVKFAEWVVEEGWLYNEVTKAFFVVIPFYNGNYDTEEKTGAELFAEFITNHYKQ
jgi:hypothetical protein